MNVFGLQLSLGFGGNTNDGLTAPFPSATVGFKLRLLGGDVYEPSKAREPYVGTPPDAELNWFNSKPITAWRFHCPLPILPFFSLGIGGFGMYVGAKVYGFDSQAYKDYPFVDSTDIYPESRAMCFTMRFTSKRPR